MLKKSKTKFSYARRILALPLLFILSFIYLINAKNKEITNTNLEIKNAVSQLKSDTIKTNKKINSITQNDIAVGTDGTKLNQDHPQLFIDNDKIIEHDVSESPEFKQRIAEAQKSAAEADRLVNSPAFKKRIKDAEKKALEADRLFNSPAFKKRIEDAERKAAETDRIVNSPEFKKKIEEAEKKAAEADRLFNSPAFKKRIEEAEKKAAEGEKLVYSIKFSSDIKNAEKKATEAVRKLKYEFKQNTEGAEIIAVEPTTYQPNSGIKFSDDVDIFIDEKPATREEMQILDPKKIESVHVYKKESSGNKRGQIYIKLKK